MRQQVSTGLYEMVELLYSEDNGQPSIEPVVLLKMVLLQHLYGLPSLRRTADEVGLNAAYRWFPGYTLLQRLGSGDKLSQAQVCCHKSQKAGQVEIE